MLKKILIWGFVAIVVLGVVTVIALFMSINVLVKKGVEAVGPPLTKSDVKLASAHLSPFSGSGQLTGLVIGNPAGYASSNAISIGDLQLAVDLASVKSDVVIIKTLRIQNPEITYEGGLTGKNNIRQILDNLEAATGGGAKNSTASSPASSGGKKIIIQDVVIEGAKVHAHLTGLVSKEITLPLPPLHLQNLGAPGQGLAIGDAVQQIIKPLFTSITDEIAKEAGSLGKEAANNLLKNAGGETSKALNKAGDAIKGLFKK
ncbi:MAG: hypothetical protein RLZZ350_1168 [Verrucomicrobiota bacterium]|jgi:uncharacterized protein involved in outer membrane biogenesis